MHTPFVNNLWRLKNLVTCEQVFLSSKENVKSSLASEKVSNNLVVTHQTHVILRKVPHSRVSPWDILLLWRNSCALGDHTAEGSSRGVLEWSSAIASISISFRVTACRRKRVSGCVCGSRCGDSCRGNERTLIQLQIYSIANQYHYMNEQVSPLYYTGWIISPKRRLASSVAPLVTKVKPPHQSLNENSEPTARRC